MPGGGAPSRSASTIVANIASGYHILKIDGYSRTLATPTGKYIASLPFTVGGHRWYIRYYPNGNKSDDKDYISLFLHLHDNVTKPVEAQYKYRFVGVVAKQPLHWENCIASASIAVGGTLSSSKGKTWNSRSISGTIHLPFGAMWSSPTNCVSRRQRKPLLRPI